MIRLIRILLDEALFLHAGKKSGNRGVGQMKEFLQIPGSGCRFLHGQITKDQPLGGGQLHLPQRRGGRLLIAGVQNPDPVAKMLFQRDHLLNKM